MHGLVRLLIALSALNVAADDVGYYYDDLSQPSLRPTPHPTPAPTPQPAPQPTLRPTPAPLDDDDDEDDEGAGSDDGSGGSDDGSGGNDDGGGGSDDGGSGSYTDDTPVDDDDDCVNNDSTSDSYGDTCSSYYDSTPGDCGTGDDEDFTASEQCCACAANDDNCVNDESTTGLYGTDCSTYEYYPAYCGNYDDEDFTASLQCCACGGYLGKTSAPTTTPAPSIYCGCNRTLVVAVDSGYYYQYTNWTLTMGDAPDSCVDGSASGGPYSDADTLYTQEITICEDVTYTIEIECCWNENEYFYLELDGSRFRENEEYTQHYSIEFTSLATTFFLRGSLTFGGISYETALANEAVFVAAIAWMCDVEEATVSVTISQAARRLAKAGRRLDDGGVTVAYDVALDDGVDVMTIIDRVDGYTEAAIDATFILVADDAGVANVFETLVTTEAGTPTVTDPYGPYSFSYKYTMPPTFSPAPSLSPAPTVSLTEPPSMTPAPTVTFAPTRSPYEYDQPTDDAPTYCRVDDVSVCWGNSRRFLRVAGRRPFDTTAWPDDLENYNPAFGDIDHDGDLDMVVGA